MKPKRARFVAASALLATLSLVAASAHAGLPGQTIDVPFDAQRVTQHPEEAHILRLYLAPQIATSSNEPGAPRAPLPLVVFLHGVNTDHRAFRFAGHGGEPDVREIAARLMAETATPPFVLAAPSTVVFSDFPASLWPAFDLDRLFETTARTLRDRVAIDPRRVIVVGHSGAGCNARGGVFAAAHDTTLALRGVMLVDTCLDLPHVPLLLDLPTSVDVVVTYQTRAWPRPFDEHLRQFLEPRRERLRADPLAKDTLAIEEARTPSGRHVHNAMVEEALRAYLPRLLRTR